MLRYVAFASEATNLVVPHDAASDTHIFVHDRQTAKTELVSVYSDGSQIACQSASAYDPAISADGRFVTFSCQPDPFRPIRIFLRDRRAHTTELVSLASSGAIANGSTQFPTISGDGRFVAFQSAATNLDPTECAGGDQPQQAICSTPLAPTFCAIGISERLRLNADCRNRIFVRDLVRRTTRVVSRTPNGTRANGDSVFPSISPDGRYVAFTSWADNLAANNSPYHCGRFFLSAQGTEPSCPDVYLHDLTTNQNELISVGLDGQSANGPSGNSYFGAQRISADNRHVTFESLGTNIVPNNPGAYIYVRDRNLGRTETPAVNSSGEVPSAAGEGFSGSFPSISADGRYVVFNTLIRVPEPGPFPAGIAVHDRLTGATEYGPINRFGQLSPRYANSASAEVSRDGRYVSFYSDQSDLVENDTNGKGDVFVRDRGAALGVGGLAGTGRLDVAGAPGFRTTGVADAIDVARDVDGVLAAQGADLIRAALVYRPRHNDVFVRVELAQMPVVTAAPSVLAYVLSLETGAGARYELRVTKSGIEPDFSLYRNIGAGHVFVARVSGGYGTTGQEVVAAVPLSQLGLQDGGLIKAARVTAGLLSVGGAGLVTSQPHDRVDLAGLGH